MKNSSICPKCNANGIIRIPGNVGLYGVGNNIYTGKTKFSAVKVTRFVCEQCGYSEEWIEGNEQIQRLKAKYKQQ